MMNVDRLSSRHVAVKLVLLGIVALWTGAGWALDSSKPMRRYLIDVWQQSTGLPQNNVKAIAQTHDGYLWIATKAGLARFDGARFVRFDDRHPDQLQESEVWSVAETDDGALWIGTYGGGLSRLKDGKFTSYRAGASGLLSDFVSVLASGADGELWIGSEQGLCRMKDGRFSAFGLEDGLPALDVRALHFDKDNTLWIGTRGGLASFRAGRLVNYAKRHPGRLDSSITGIVVADGAWISTSGSGLVQLQGDVVKSYTVRDGLPSDTVNALVADAQGTLWVGSDNGLCSMRNGRISKFYSEVSTRLTTGVLETVSLHDIQALSFDREGSLWMGTTSDGLVRLRDGVFDYVDEREGLTNLYCSSVIEDRKGAIWIGTSSGLARLFHGELSMYSKAQGLSHSTVTSLAEDDSGSIWVGTGQGLSRVRDGRAERIAAAALDRLLIQTVTPDNRGSIWIGTERGVFRWRDGEVTPYTSSEGLLGSQVRAAAIDAQGKLWIGTKDGGLTRLQGGRLVGATDPDKGARESIASILTADKDTVWVATRRGLKRFKGGQVATLTVQRGLPTNYVYAVIDDGRGDYWLTFAGGIARVSKRALNEAADGTIRGVSCVTYGAEHGLRSMSMAVGRGPTTWRSRDGRLWFATGRGVAIVDPENMPTNRLAPPILVEEIVVDGRSRGLPKRASFEPGHGKVEIRYTGLSFLLPERVQFQYRLEGFDEQWINAGNQRVAYYTNLNPRQYRFRVKACNSDSVCNEKGDEYLFTLSPHWYQRKLWYPLLFVVLGALTYGAVHWRMQAVRARRTADEERDLLHALMDNIPDLIFFKDAESRFTRVNTAHAEALGLKTPAQAIGRTEASFHDEEHAREVLDAERELLATRQALTGRVEHEARSGRWYLVTKVPLRDKAGRVTGLVGISKDITERKVAEEKLEQDLAELLDTVNAIAQGELTRRGGEGDDALGRIARSVNQMLGSFTSILTEVRDAAFSVSTSSAEILAAAAQIAKGARYGSDEVNATSAAVEEMTASMARVSANAEASAESAQQALEHARSGEQAVNATVLGMARIDQSVSETANKMRLLEHRSKQVFEIIHLIEEIASQSTLLSLNAAIEAAHAGDAGLGFGVVAEEIRRLAERSTAATKDVTAIVEGMVEETRAVLAAMERGLSEVRAGHELTERAEKSLTEIGALVQNSAHLAADISQASREQLRATQTVAQAMHSISGVTEESAASATEATRAVQDLVSLSDHLVHAISRFKIESLGTRRAKTVTGS